jgi:uncharacterized protein YegJ (DUF2314 family)
MSESPIFFFNDNDPLMQRAYERARASFRYFWRELFWERRRIIPALDLACVKAPFSDPVPLDPDRDEPPIEQMWLDDIDFDGRWVTGTLLNEPTWLTSVSMGDEGRFTLDQITDWMYVSVGEVYGGFTVNLIRSKMSPHELKQHDEAWGLNFGDPKKPRVVVTQEHPMSEIKTPELAEEIALNPELVHGSDDRGWTMLHHEALAGNAGPVRVLLDFGADPNARTDDGATPLQLAHAMGWETIVMLLKGRGARA